MKGNKWKTRSWVIVVFCMILSVLGIIGQLILASYSININLTNISLACLGIIGAYVGVKQPLDSIKDYKLGINRAKKDD